MTSWPSREAGPSIGLASHVSPPAARVGQGVNMELRISRCAALMPGLLLALAIHVAGGGMALADELDDIAKAGVLKVGIFEDFPPFSSAGPDMKSQGYDIDVIAALAKALNVKPQLVGITGQNRIPILTEHKANLLITVAKSPEREKIIDF